METEKAPADKKIGKYEIIKVLGRGGMGEVLLAQDEDLGRMVAIKRPFKSAAEDGLARFQVEAKAATLRHPNIPTVYEMGVQDGLPFIAMEFVEGEPLDKLISSGRHLDLITKLRIIEQVSLALGYAHENGIIHRDIKPANVIVQKDGVAKIIDFGIAKLQDSDGKGGLTQTSAVIGSLHYIAPERFKGGPIDGRVDIFSAGVTLFKLLTGQEPFTGGEATASYKIVNEAHSPLSSYITDYPPVLDEVVAKSLAKNPEDRYSTGEDFADALHEVIEDLKKNRITELFSDAERLTMESRYTPALELLEEAARLDPANTQVRKLRRLVREHQDRVKKADRLRECTTRADEALVSGNFDDALTHLREAQNLDTTSTDIRQRIQSIEEKKRRHEISAKALTDAEAARSRGDITAALRILGKALQEDPESTKIIALNQTLTRQVEFEAQRRKFIELIERGRRELTARNFPAVEALLAEAGAIDSSSVEIDQLRGELERIRGEEQRRKVLEQIQLEIGRLIDAGDWERADDFLDRALEKLPSESSLRALKTRVALQLKKHRLKLQIDAVVAQAQETFQSSPGEALLIVQRAMQELGSDERLASLEVTLRERLKSAEKEEIRNRYLRDAQASIDRNEYAKAVEILESYQSEFSDAAGVEDLLEMARGEVVHQQRRERVASAVAEAKTLMKGEQYAQAVRILEPIHSETGDPALSRLLADCRAQLDEMVRRSDQLVERVNRLRTRGSYGEAIGLLQGHPDANDRGSKVATLLAEIRAEDDRQKVRTAALAAAAKAAEKLEFSVAIEEIQKVERAYGQSAELTEAIKGIQKERSSHAEQVVGQSIEAAQAALLKNDPQGAVEALKTATPWMEFADQKKQGEWRRIGDSVKEALKQSGTQGKAGSEFDAELSKIAGTKPRKSLVGIIVPVFLAVAAIGGIVLWKTLPSRTAAPATETHLVFAVLPHGALVSVDKGAPIPTDAQGRLTIPVKPNSTHHIQVSNPGYASFEDDLTVKPGDSLPGPLILTPLPPAGVDTGTLSVLPQSDVAKVRVYIDGKTYGTKANGEKIPLSVGTHTVKYSWPPDYQDSKEHTVIIAKDKDIADSFTLDKAAPLPPSAARLAILTTPGAQVSIDGGQRKGQADPYGNYSADAITPGQHSIEIAMDGYQPQSRQLSIAAGQTQQIAVPLTQIPPKVQPSGTLAVSSNSIEAGKSVTLTWDVNNAPSVSLNGVAVAPRGSKTDSPNAKTTYILTAGNTPLAEQTVDVHEAAKPQPATPAPAVVNTPPAPPKVEGPDKAALDAALKSYTSIFANASGKSGKECQGVFNGALQGKLRAWSNWCDSAKAFKVAEDCGAQVGGSPTVPSLTCNETLTVVTKDGDPQVTRGQKTFHFAKGPDGSWQLTGW